MEIITFLIIAISMFCKITSKLSRDIINPSSSKL